MLSKAALILIMALAIAGLWLYPARDETVSLLGAASLNSPSEQNCQSSWQINVFTDTSKIAGKLNAVAAVDRNNVWAVGHYLTMHWDGSRWSQIFVPEASRNDNFLQAMAIVKPDDIWAVGGYVPITDAKTSSGFDILDLTLIEHWDGLQWSIVPSPNPGAENWLYGVAAIGTGDIWAVGESRETYWRKPLVLHWDGVSWKQVPTPDLQSLEDSRAELYSIAAIEKDDVWAVGSQNIDADGFGGETLVLHWNGKKWAEVQGLGRGRLLGIAASNPKDIWTVGYFSTVRRHEGGLAYTLAAHWNGKKWTKVETPNPGDYGSRLAAVTIASPRNVWAVGTASASHQDGYHAETLILRWDGRAWVRLPRSIPSVNNDFLGVDAAGQSEIWAVGEDYAQTTVPVITQYNKPCKPSPSKPSPQSRTNPTMRIPDPDMPGVSYFSITGHTLRSGFRAYWEKHGDLEQFGYPITEEFKEDVYTVQYFERAKFEWHPEAAPQFRVRQGSLSYPLITNRLKERPFEPYEDLQITDAEYFSETKHNVTPAFLEYWGAHGGEAVYGYPISEAFTELNAADGKPYVVQYFPRQRFEYHPELPDGHRITMGLLGVEVAKQQGLLP